MKKYKVIPVGEFTVEQWKHMKIFEAMLNDESYVDLAVKSAREFFDKKDKLTKN